jgi:hypothetical protein
VIREAERGTDRMRLWMNADGPLGEASDGLAVKWVGHAGHPSSYGLLGGHAASVAGLDLPEQGTYGASLAKSA